MSTTLSIAPDERAQLEALARNVKDAKTAIRIRAILALDDGLRVRDVAIILRLDEDTVTKWRNKFKKRKLFSDWLSTNTKGYAGRLTPEQERAVDQFVSREMATGARQVVSFIKDRYASTTLLTVLRSCSIGRASSTSRPHLSPAS